MRIESVEEGHDLIKQGQTLFLEIFKMGVVHRLNVFLTAMDFAIDSVMGLAQLREVCV